MWRPFGFGLAWLGLAWLGFGHCGGSGLRGSLSLSLSSPLSSEVHEPSSILSNPGSRGVRGSEEGLPLPVITARTPHPLTTVEDAARARVSSRWLLGNTL